MVINHKEILLPHPNRIGTRLEAVKALVFHYTANDRPTATDEMNARYFGRAYQKIGNDYYERDGKTPFSYGSAQIICDEDSCTIAIPENEVAWSVGDRRLPWTDRYRGQQPISKTLFNFRPNYQSISIEICNNASWRRAYLNSARWAVDYIKRNNLSIDLEYSLDPQNENRILQDNHIVLLRHFDISGKVCPKPFVDNMIDWQMFVTMINDSIHNNIPIPEV